jgi:perosamine synthetase
VLVPVNRPVVTKSDIEAVASAVESTWLSGESPAIAELEVQLANEVGAKHAIAVSSGTAACDLVSEAIGLGSNSTVVAPATTIISTVSHAARLGARIHVVDVDPNSWCIDVDAVQAAMSGRPAAVFAVHLFGLAANMADLNSIVAHSETLIIEDAAEALGQEVNGGQCGAQGTAGIFSFYANKIVTSGEGGAVVTSSDELATEVRRLRNLYFDPAERFVHQRLGFNARMSGVAAALVSSQLTRLPDLLLRKRELGARYSSNLSGHPWLQLPQQEWNDVSNCYWVFPVLLTEDSPLRLVELRQKLLHVGVDTRRFFYPLNKQPALLNLGLIEGGPTPVADKLWDNGLYLPSGIGTTDAEIDYVSEELWKMA